MANMTKEQALRFAECLKNNWTIDFDDMEPFCNYVKKALEERKGEWIDRPLFSKCSICGCEVSMCERKSQGYKYCPKCGADMKGESKCI